MKPRLARPSDLEALPELAAAASDEVDLFVLDDDQGFLILKKSEVRGMMQDRESIVLRAVSEHGLASLLQAAIQAARGYGSQYLTMEAAPAESRLRQALEEQGFRLESHRIAVPAAPCPTPEGSPYAVRRAEPGDHFPIAVLHSTTLEHTLSAERRYDLGDLTFRSMGAIFAQLERHDPGTLALVLTLGSELVGYLLLQDGYIYDLAVTPEHWGGMAVRHIMRAGSRALFESQVPAMVGDVSHSNRRALLFAQRALGFKVERVRYGLTL